MANSAFSRAASDSLTRYYRLLTAKRNMHREEGSLDDASTPADAYRETPTFILANDPASNPPKTYAYAVTAPITTQKPHSFRHAPHPTLVRVMPVDDLSTKNLRENVLPRVQEVISGQIKPITPTREQYAREMGAEDRGLWGGFKNRVVSAISAGTLLTVATSARGPIAAGLKALAENEINVDMAGVQPPFVTVAVAVGVSSFALLFDVLSARKAEKKEDKRMVAEANMEIVSLEGKTLRRAPVSPSGFGRAVAA